MKLTNLMSALEVVAYPDDPLPERDVTAVCYRAQEVGPGGVFVAIEGYRVDGHDFIDEAFARGAAAVVCHRKVDTNGCLVRVADTRKALAVLAAAFYDHPSRGLFLIGVTGTNGKTTVSYLVEHMLAAAGQRVGVIGTVNYRYGSRKFENPVTTPESQDLQRILREMSNAGITHVVMEVSSHALALHRVADCAFDLCLFTNLTQDHLDFHGTMEAYWACKQQLFLNHLACGPKRSEAMAVINRDNPWGRELSTALDLPVVTVGRDASNTVCFRSLDADLAGTSGTLVLPEGKVDFRSPLVGRHNGENILCAAGSAVAMKLPAAAVKAGIGALDVVPGRLEPIPNQAGIYIYVDYAHTPDALGNVLRSLREMTACKIICVFGCGGDRDRGKRPKMGRVAARLSDLAVVTSDNPRSEAPLEIISQITAGMSASDSTVSDSARQTDRGGGHEYMVEPDRRSAIQMAIESAEPGDAVLIAGKGHETYQIIAGKKLPFDDRAEALRVLATL